MTALAFSLELDGREVDVQIGAADTTADYTLDMESTAPLVIACRTSSASSSPRASWTRTRMAASTGRSR